MSVTTPAPAVRAPRVLSVLLFAVYLFLLVWIVLWKLGTPSIGDGELRAVKLVPFVAGDGYGASSPFEMAANVALFVPLGLYLGLLAPRWSWLRIVVASALTSIALEVAQYILAIGSSDITDVILNTTGAALGVVVLAVARRGLRGRAGRVVLVACAVGTAAAVLLAALAVASPVRFGPPHDVRAPRGGLPLQR
jgi:glycopeptide antibiotics resistance protein